MDLVLYNSSIAEYVTHSTLDPTWHFPCALFPMFGALDGPYFHPFSQWIPSITKILTSSYIDVFGSM
jgi:hypothetical protein